MPAGASSSTARVAGVAVEADRGGVQQHRRPLPGGQCGDRRGERGRWADPAVDAAPACTRRSSACPRRPAPARLTTASAPASTAGSSSPVLGPPLALAGSAGRAPDQPDDLVPVGGQLPPQVRPEEAGRARHHDPHASRLSDAQIAAT